MKNNGKVQSSNIRVLSIGGDQEQLVSIRQMLEGGGHKAIITGADTEQEAEHALKKNVWDVIFVTANNIEPAALKRYVQQAAQRSSTPVLAIADDVDDQAAAFAYSMGVRDVVNLFNPQRFLLVLQRELTDLDERRNHLIVKSQFRLTQKELVAHNAQEGDGGGRELLVANDANSKKLMTYSCAKYDLATNLYSQQYFMAELTNVLSEIDAIKKKYAVLYFEFSSMTAIRSELGINASENLLNEIASIMRDNIGQLGPIARFSNQVFAVLVAFSNIDELLKVINITRAMVSDHIRLSFVRKGLGSQINVGMCMVNKMSGSAYQLIAKAERACDIATSINQSGVHIYNPEIDDAESKNQSNTLRNWEKQIRLALLDGRFKVVFQMISRLDSAGGNDYELLFRMKDKDANVDILPGEFIVTAEQTGLIVVIDQWVTSQAIKMVAADMEQGRDGRYFVKLSSRTLLSDSYIPWLQEELKKQAIDTTRLVFEINTTELVKRPIEVQAFTRALKNLKCLVALEYFGTQKNHMTIMEQFSVDFIKLDRSLTHNLAGDLSRLGPVKAIVSEANTAHVETMAEFIEDAQTLSILCNAGIGYIQGHFVQHPGGSLGANSA